MTETVIFVEAESHKLENKINERLLRLPPHRIVHVSTTTGDYGDEIWVHALLVIDIK